MQKQNKTQTHLEFLKKTSPIIVLTILFLINILLILKTPYVLTGDEIFYYDQAQNIKKGEFVYFDNTQPFAYPLLLATIPTDNIHILRIITSFLFIIGLYFLFKITEHLMNRTAGLIAITIAGLAKFSIQTATLLLTEPLFVLTSSASIWFFIKLLKNNKLKDYMCLVFWLIIALQTKITNMVIPLALFVYLIAYEPKKFTIKNVSAILIPFLSLIPYFALTKGKFLIEKVIIDNTQILPSPYFMITTSLFYFTIPFILLLVFLALFCKTENEEKIFTTLAFTYILLLIASKTILYPRHMYPFFFFFIPLIILGVLKQKNILKVSGSILLFVFLIINTITIPNLPEFEGNNYFFNIPDNCVELKEFNLNKESSVTLPYFQQPSKSTHIYSTTFFTKNPLNTLSINYVDDHIISLIIDKKHIIKNTPYGTPERATTLTLEDTIHPGHHIIEITILNMQNIGGIGQMLLCEDKTKLVYENLKAYPKV